MIYLIALIVILLIVILFVLFYSPKAPKQRRAVQPAVQVPAAGQAPELLARGAVTAIGEEQELAPADIAEVQEGAAAEQELTLELTGEELALEEPAAVHDEELTLEMPESEAPAAVAEATGPVAAPAEEIPFILEEEPRLPDEGEMAPALAGIEEDAGLRHEETPEDLAERLDFFFGSDEDTGEGPEDEGLVAEAGAPEEAVLPEEPAPLPPAAAAPTGLTLAQYEAGLRRQEERLRQELERTIAARETGKLGLLESELTAICARIAELPGSLAAYTKLVEDLEGLLPRMTEALPGFQAETARQHLRGGEVEVARALLTEAALQVPAASALPAEIRFLCGRLAEEQGEFAVAGELYQQACTGAEPGPAILAAAGRMARILGNDEEARQRLESILAAGGEGEVQDQARHELARVFLRAEEKDKAEPLLQQALAGLEGRRGATDPALGPVLHDLAALHESSGQYEQAEPLYRRALAVCEQGLGPEHPRLAPILARLAGLYEEMEQEEQARPLYERALAIRQRVLGASHPDIGILLNHQANILKQRGEYAKAEPMFLRALDIAEKALGADHPNLTVILNNLAELYSETGDEEKAEHFQERAFALFELPGAGGDFVEMEKEQVDVDADKEKTIAGS